VMKHSRKFVLSFAAGLCLLAGGCATHDHAVAKWEYKTIVLANDATPLDPPERGWISNDVALNEMVKQGWIVVSYQVDNIHSQWILVKRRVR